MNRYFPVMQSVCIVFVMVLGLGLTAVVESKNASNTTNKQKPNVVFFMVDDLGFHNVGYNGNRFVHTPNLDALAKCDFRQALHFPLLQPISLQLFVWTLSNSCDD
eukprot:m.174763 g.174763  ORF g.174763 m.174763 type:complete len:105 (-) comp13510_c0_seq3:3305-3619(-)